MTPKRMSLNDFCVEALADVDRFETYWCNGNAVDPEGFPMDMKPGDWHEQFLMFLSFGEAA